MITHVTVQTAKQAETVEFYQWLLGLPVARTLETPNGPIIFLGGGETALELIANDTAEPINAKGLTIGFAVDDLDKKLVLLDSRQIRHSDIIAPGHDGIRFAYFTDLNGCAIQLFEAGK
ncbi:MAG: VOC family protein [Coriobacteriia bacterium]|nr:VOC family protein [Coriobacteriia bacterium]